MSNVELKIFGETRIVANGVTHRHFATTPCLKLLVIVALAPTARISRKEATKLIWEDPVSSGRLSVTLYQLKQALNAIQPGLATCIAADRRDIWIVPGEISTDYRKWKQVVTAVERWSHYAGPLASDLSGSWLAAQREDAVSHAGHALVHLCLDTAAEDRSGLLADALHRDPALSHWVLEALGAIRTAEGRTSACVLAEQLLEGGRAMGELRSFLRKESRDDQEGRRLWYLVLADTPPGPFVVDRLAGLGAREGKTHDFWLADSPDTAWEVGRKILRERPHGRVYHSICLMDEEQPLPSGVRSEASRAPTRGNWCPRKAAWLYSEHNFVVTGEGDYQELKPKGS